VVPIKKYEMDQFLTGLGFKLDYPPPANEAQSAQSISRLGLTYGRRLDRGQVVVASEVLMPKEVTLEFHPAYQEPAYARASISKSKRLTPREYPSSQEN
jgi:hypothetical protein